MAALISSSVAPQPEQDVAVRGLSVPHFGHLMEVGALTLGSGGRAALQNGQVVGRKLGETIFLPHSGHFSGPEVVSGGLKHI
jgi:hypothetical protein